MNLVVLKGRLVRDVEVRTSQSGKSVARFTVAVDRPKSKGQEKSEADFIGCVAFDLRAETIAKYFGKGDAIIVEGTIRTGSYEKNGQKVYTTDIWVNGFEFCESKKSSGEKSSFGTVVDSGHFDEDIPF